MFKKICACEKVCIYDLELVTKACHAKTECTTKSENPIRIQDADATI